MNIEIKGTALNPNYYNSFVIECTAMFGDVDGYSLVEMGGFKINKDEEHFTDLLNVLEQMKKATRRNINGIEGFDKWFDVDSLTEEEYEVLPDVVKNATEYWLRDPQSHGEYYAALNDYKVFYYDENGVKHNVSVEL